MACWASSAALVLATDVDGTMVSSDYLVPPEAAALAHLLEEAGAVIVLVTSKTLDEARIYLEEKLRLPPCPGYAAIVEEGGAVYSPSPGVLPEGLAELAPRIDPWMLAERLSPPGCSLKPVNAMTPSEVSALTGLPPREAEAARRRLYTAALHGPRRCLEEAYRRARSLGLYARLGRIFLMAGRVPGKAAALRQLLSRSPLLRSAPVAALGDDPMDEEMLNEADEAIVVPGPEGPRAKPRRTDYHVAPASPPRGWVEAVRGLLWGLGGLHG